MHFNFQFKTVESEKEVRKTIDFIREYPLNYLNYSDWTEKVYYQLMNGEKQAIIAISEEKIVADLISQEITKNLIEIKNLRTHYFLQKRGFANFMLNQFELEASKKYNGIITDTRRDNTSVINLFEKRGYKRINEKNLYDKFTDIIYYKSLTPNLKTLSPSF